MGVALIGASLSEPHINGTAMRAIYGICIYVYMYKCIYVYMYNICIYGSRNAHLNFAQNLFSNRKYRKGRVRAMAAPSSEDNRKRCSGFFAG